MVGVGTREIFLGVANLVPDKGIQEPKLTLARAGLLAGTSHG